MASRIKFNVSAIPIETLTNENSGTKDVIASEVNKILGGGGDSIDLSNYAGTLIQQGYKDGAVGYLSVTHSAGGTQISTRANPDFIFIKNTGYKYSTATALGVATTDCVLVALKINAYAVSTQGGWIKSDAVAQIHFIEIAWLKPGQAIVLPTGAMNLSITQFGSNANDLTKLDEDIGADQEQSTIFAKTYTSAGSAASSANAVEFLSVT